MSGAACPPVGQLTAGTLLGGRVVYRQPLAGYRTGIEPVLLAASIPARPGERVLEGGTGAGAGLLCLCARVPGLSGEGVEIDPGMAALAEDNFRANGFDGLSAAAADLTGWTPVGVFDHAFANPPWHDARGTASPDGARRTALMAPPGLLAAWTARLAAGLRRRGTLTLILPASALGEGLAALAQAGCGETEIMPLWPHAGLPARLVILRGLRGGTARSERILAGLVLHQRGGGYTVEAEALLRGPEALPFVSA